MDRHISATELHIVEWFCQQHQQNVYERAAEKMLENEVIHEWLDAAHGRISGSANRCFNPCRPTGDNTGLLSLIHHRAASRFKPPA